MSSSKLLFGCLLFCLSCISQPTQVFAQVQDTTATYRVATSTGNVFFGTIISEDEEQVVLQTKELGQITIQRKDIISIEVVEPERIKNGEYWFPNPHGTRYLFSTNAIGLKAGEGYYQNAWIFFNNINAGITDNISLGGGFIPVFLFGASAWPVWILPKASIPLLKGDLHLAAGGIFGGVIGLDTGNNGLGLAYGVLTYGDEDNNISLGTGFGYGNGEWSDIPLFNISGMSRLNKTMYFISENYFMSFGDDNFGVMSGAFRWAPENFAVDFGLFRPFSSGDGSFPGLGIPWLGITFPFGN